MSLRGALLRLCPATRISYVSSRRIFVEVVASIAGCLACVVDLQVTRDFNSAAASPPASTLELRPRWFLGVPATLHDGRGCLVVTMVADLAACIVDCDPKSTLQVRHRVEKAGATLVRRGFLHARSIPTNLLGVSSILCVLAFARHDENPSGR